MSAVKLRSQTEKCSGGVAVQEATFVGPSVDRGVVSKIRRSITVAMVLLWGASAAAAAAAAAAAV